MIEPRYYALIELLIFGAFALGIGFWQLWSVNRDLKRGREQQQDKDPPA